MPRIIGHGTTTYLLLSGIVVSRPIELSEWLQLLPINESEGGQTHLEGLQLMDKQFALLMLPWVQSQLRVTGKDPKEVMVRAWGALWDVLLLSAIYGERISSGLQSTTALEEFDESSRLLVIHHRFIEPPRSDGRRLSDSDGEWLEKYYGSARELLNDHRFQTAVHCLSTFHWHSLPRAQLSLLWAGIEGLFGVDSEIVFRISLYTAKFLEPSDQQMQREIFDNVKRLYGARSRAVHGGKMKGEPSESVRESVALLNQLIRTCIERSALPVVNDLIL